MFHETKAKANQIDSLIFKEKADLDFLYKDLIDGKKMNLIYRGSVDGFKPADFHRMCDDKGPTLSVVKTTGGEIVGGFTKIPWKSDGGDKQDADAFVFSVNQMQKFKATGKGLTKSVQHY